MKNIQRLTLKGIPAAPGLAHGKTVFVVQQKIDIPNVEIEDPGLEIARLLAARDTSRCEIIKLKENVQSRAKSNEADIFEAHRMILEDVALLEKAEDAIQQGTNAEKAWMDSIEFFAQMMEQIPDETLSSRAADIRDVGRRVVCHLLGIATGGATLKEEAIVVGDDLTPSDTAGLDKALVKAFCTAKGGPISHTAILAKAFGLPAVVGLGTPILNVPEGTMVLVDGEKGEVVVAPTEAEIVDFIAREGEDEKKQTQERKVAQAPAVTADNTRVEIVANVVGLEDAPLGIKNGAEGIGLFRTEFLYLDRKSLPTEEEQIDAYTSVFKMYEGLPVVVRTLDIGGDKAIPYLDLPEELNPFLGWRGIRMIDGQEGIFLTQFRSLLQAGARVEVDLRIMLPMVSGLGEIRAGRALMVKAQKELDAEGKPYTKDIQFGIMVEVPSAAILADRLANEVDFFSIGTNDLTQYTLAVDRTNSRVAYLADSLNPAVLTLIKFTIDSAHQKGKWVGLCGELAGQPLAIPVLLGLNLDEFSMSPTSIPVVKRILQKLHVKDCIELAEEVLKLNDHQEVTQACQAFFEKHGLEN